VSTDTEQPCRRYSGVTRHAGKWLVKVRYGRQDLTLGHYEDPAEAARTADFARYMLYGLRHVCWPARVARPNGPPTKATFNISFIFRELARRRLIPTATLLSRLYEYFYYSIDDAAADC
jgi:hypothetical protein